MIITVQSEYSIGRFRIFTRDHHGEELELAALRASQFFGEMSFLTGKPRSSWVMAMETSVTVELSYSSMRKVIKEHPTVKKVLVEYYNDREGETAKKRGGGEQNLAALSGMKAMTYWSTNWHGTCLIKE